MKHSTNRRNSKNKAHTTDCLFEARRQGFAYLTPQEHRLIEQLRLTSHSGRALVYELAGDVHRARPWVM